LPERCCIVTREVKNEDALIRFALSPDGIVVPDLHRKLPGRGVWVSLDRAKVAEAINRGLFSRGFKAKAEAEIALVDRIGQMLRQQVVSHLSLTRKSGDAVAGFMKVEDALKKGRVRLVFHGDQAAADGTRKLNRLMPEQTIVCDFLSGDELDLAFGRTNVVHAAIGESGLASRLVYFVRRVALYENRVLKDDRSEDAQ
jgi:uncharacterized protein